MQSPPAGTWFKRLTPFQATLVLLAFVAAVAGCLAIILRAEPAATETQRRPGDLELYREIVKRVRAGEDYYSAAGAELRDRNFGARSIFSWRTPLYAWVIGKPPSPLWAQGLLAAGALITMILTYAAVRRQHGGPMA